MNIPGNKIDFFLIFLNGTNEKTQCEEKIGNFLISLWF
jgi:hypothetical protein